MKFKFSYLLGILGYGLWITYGIVMTVQSSGDSVPFWGLSEKTTTAILLLIWPLAVGVITLFISVKFLAPLFLWIKRKLQKHHTFAYLPHSANDLEHNQLKLDNLLPKVLFGRIFQLFLLTLGLVDAFINAGILLPENFVTSSQLDNWIGAGIEARYTAVVLAAMLSLILPIAFGLWMISWVLQDAGILQFDLPISATSLKLYEIRPVHKIYSAIISGYGGFSSILFYTGFFIYYFSEYSSRGGNFGDLFIILILGLSALSLLPVYILYLSLSNTHIRKDLREAPILTSTILNP